MAKEPAYLGDGLYASFDGYMIELSAEQSDGMNRVYLESNVLDEFFRYVEKIHNVKIKVERTK